MCVLEGHQLTPASDHTSLRNFIFCSGHIMGNAECQVFWKEPSSLRLYLGLGSDGAKLPCA